MGKKAKKTSREKKAEEKEAKQSSSKTLPIIIIVVTVLAIGSYFFYSKYNTNATTRQAQASGVQKDASGNVEALRGGEERQTLSPSLFVGKVAAAYKIARENRELLDSMYCYCYCKENFGHKSLLSCYVDNHAANCGICMQQAFLAYQLHQKGYDIAQVREGVDREFWRPMR